ncbi:trypsin-like peptidase domain-containing protein [Patescibacteria group bacterium]|nr:trypsin-like peptidase domain-containing protein [Patescibacteria group bacterium]
MGLYDLPQFNFSEKIKRMLRGRRKNNIKIVTLAVSLSIVFGFISGAATSTFFYFQFSNNIDRTDVRPFVKVEDIMQIEEIIDDPIVKAVEKSSPAVVSVVIGEKGGGTGFLVSEDGLILTNKHVVLDEKAEYTVFTSDGEEFSAKVLARDPLQDLAIIKISQEDKLFPVLELGDSDDLRPGQTVIAIGNALAEFKNTVSTGVVSGLGRTITASGGTFVETLEDIIQTDAAINKGNSGGPLLNLEGKVIGINTAMALDAQSIGFAIPINKAKRAIEQIQTIGRIVYPFIGIRYVMVNEKVKEEYGLTVDYGVLITKGGLLQPSITPGSPAEEVGLEEKDVVLEINNEKINAENSLAEIILKYNPGEEVTLKVLRDDQELEIKLTLTERPE